jgi:hypothetical protein
MAASAVLAEVTIAWGEDTHCTGCGCLLPAGAPAWPTPDGGLECADCTPAEGGDSQTINPQQ